VGKEAQVRYGPPLVDRVVCVMLVLRLSEVSSCARVSVVCKLRPCTQLDRRQMFALTRERGGGLGI
jgi:hypothetical protein